MSKRTLKTFAKKASHSDLTHYALESICKRKPFEDKPSNGLTRCKLTIPHNPDDYTEEGLLKRVIDEQWVHTPELFDYMEAIHQLTIATIALELDKFYTEISGDIILKLVRRYFTEGIKDYGKAVITNPCFKKYIIKYIKCEILEEVIYLDLDQEQELIQKESDTQPQPLFPNSEEFNYA